MERDWSSCLFAFDSSTKERPTTNTLTTLLYYLLTYHCAFVLYSAKRHPRDVGYRKAFYLWQTFWCSHWQRSYSSSLETQSLSTLTVSSMTNVDLGSVDAPNQTPQPAGGNAEQTPLATAPSSADAPSGGSLPAPPPPPSFAARHPGGAPLQAGAPMSSPYNSSQTPSNEMQRSGYSNLSTKDMVLRIIREAARDSAQASAVTLHSGDVVAAARTTAAAFEEVYFPSDKKDGTFSTERTPGSENKFTTQAVLETLSGDDRIRAADNEKSQALKHVQHMPAFPGADTKRDLMSGRTGGRKSYRQPSVVLISFFGFTHQTQGPGRLSTLSDSGIFEVY